MQRGVWMKYLSLVFIVLCLATVGATYYYFQVSIRPSSQKSDTSSQKIIEQAKKLYQEKKASGMNFESGPCLAEQLIPDWVADIAHHPRQPVDDLPENQCISFKEGKTHHFVELDTEGNFIRIY